MLVPPPPLPALPPWERPAAMLAAVLANHLSRGQGLEDRLAGLEGRCVWVCVTDLGVCVKLRYAGRAWRPAAGASPDVTIRARALDLLDIARRRADPDTLFFQRRLQMEGDTEVGLLLRNVLDGLQYDWPAHFRSVLPPPLDAFACALYRRLCAGRRTGARYSARPAPPRQ